MCAHQRPTLCDPTDCIAQQASLSMGFSGREYWVGSRVLLFPTLGIFPTQGSKLSFVLFFSWSHLYDLNPKLIR